MGHQDEEWNVDRAGGNAGQQKDRGVRETLQPCYLSSYLFPALIHLCQPNFNLKLD